MQGFSVDGDVSDYSSDLNLLAAPSMAHLVGLVTSPDFATSIDQQQASQLIHDWFETKGTRIVSSMAANAIVQKFDDWLQNGHQFNTGDLQMLLLDASGSFIKSNEVHESLCSNPLAVQSLVVIANAKLGESVMNEVREAWQKLDPIHFETAFQIADGGYALSDTSKFTDRLHSLYYNTVVGKCKTERLHTVPLISQADNGCPSETITTIYGSEVERWLESKKQGSLNSVYIQPPNNVSKETKKVHPCTGCFLAGTNVLTMSRDGKRVEHIPIEQIKEGDLVISHNGALSVVSDEPVGRKLGDNVTMYGIKSQNGKVNFCPFFSESHPFWTVEGGWCAVNPHQANSKNGWLQTKKLGVGSTLFQVQCTRVKKHKPYKVKVIYNQVSISELTKRVVRKPIVYDLHFREGARSYHANGLVVGLNYPELTATRLKHHLAGTSHMKQSQRKQLHSAINDLSSGLSHAVGYDWPKHNIGSALSRSKRTGTHRNKHFYRNHVSLFQSYHTSNLTYKLYKHDRNRHVTTHTHLRAGKHREVPPECGKLQFVGGKVILNGQVSHKVHFTDNGHVVARMSPTVLYTRLHPTGLGGVAVKATVSEDGSQVEEVQESYSIGAENSYDTKYLKDNNWTSWFQVNTGLKNGVAVAFLSDPSESSTSTTNQYLAKIGAVTVVNGQLEVQLDFGQSSFIFGWHSGEATISDDFSSLSGTLYEYDSSADNGKGASHEWIGTITTTDDETTDGQATDDQATVVASPMVMAVAPLAESDVADGSSSLSADDSVSSEPLTSAANPTWATESMTMLASSVPMSVSELASLAAPDTSEVNTLSFDKLTNMMKATVDSGTLKTLLDETPPVLSGDEQAIIDDETNGTKARKFLVDKFFPAYAVQALSGSSELESDFDGVSGGVTVTKEKLTYFWQGAGSTEDVVTDNQSIADNVLSQDSGYDFVNNGVARLAYAESMTSLSPYLEDNPSQWASDLHDYVTATDYVNGLAVLTSASDNSKLNNLCMILYSLAPTETYATDLCSRVLQAQSNSLREHYASDDLLETFIPAVIEKMVNLINEDDGSLKLSTDIKSEIIQQTEDAMVEANVETVQALVSKFESMWEECGVYMSANRDQPVWQRLSLWWAKTTEEYPITSAIGKWSVNLFGHAVWIAAIGFSIVALVVLVKDWSALRTDEKVAIISEGSAVLSDVIAKTGKAWTNIKDFFNSDDMFTLEDAFEAEDVQQLWGGYLDDVATRYNSELQIIELQFPGTGAAGAVAAEDIQATRIWQNFTFAEKVARVTNIVAMSAAVVSMGFQVYEDFKNNQSSAVKTLDIINIVAAGIGLGAEAIALAGELGVITLTEFVAGAVIPIVGVVVAIVGIIVTIVLLLEGKKSEQKDTPIDTWVKSTGVSFIKTIPTPTTEWQNDHSS